MKRLYFYDQDGNIYFDTPYIEGYQTIGIEVPEDKILKGFDTTKEPHEPIYEDVKKDTTVDRIELLEQAMAELIGGM